MGSVNSAINRIVEDMNHRFTLDVLTRKFKSHDFGSAKDLLLRDREEMTVRIEDVHRCEIREYLEILDLVCEIDVLNMVNGSRNSTMTVFSQPGLRYCQAEALVRVLMKDEVFNSFTLKERTHITEKILEDVRGRMLEEIVLLETHKARPDLDVFRLQFAVGEFDMVVCDVRNEECCLYEIKHSAQQSENQYRHLADPAKLAAVERRFGRIAGRFVLYRGQSMVLENGIEYRNVEEYLKALP